MSVSTPVATSSLSEKISKAREEIASSAAWTAIFVVILVVTIINMSTLAVSPHLTGSNLWFQFFLTIVSVFGFALNLRSFVYALLIHRELVIEKYTTSR